MKKKNYMATQIENAEGNLQKLTDFKDYLEKKQKYWIEDYFKSLSKIVTEDDIEKEESTEEVQNALLIQKYGFSLDRIKIAKKDSKAIYDLIKFLISTNKPITDVFKSANSYIQINNNITDLDDQINKLKEEEGKININANKMRDSTLFKTTMNDNQRLNFEQKFNDDIENVDKEKEKLKKKRDTLQSELNGYKISEFFTSLNENIADINTNLISTCTVVSPTTAQQTPTETKTEKKVTTKRAQQNTDILQILTDIGIENENNYANIIMSIIDDNADIQVQQDSYTELIDDYTNYIKPIQIQNVDVTGEDKDKVYDLIRSIKNLNEVKDDIQSTSEVILKELKKIIEKNQKLILEWKPQILKFFKKKMRLNKILAKNENNTKPQNNATAAKTISRQDDQTLLMKIKDHISIINKIIVTNNAKLKELKELITDHIDTYKENLKQFLDFKLDDAKSELNPKQYGGGYEDKMGALIGLKHEINNLSNDEILQLIAYDYNENFRAKHTQKKITNDNINLLLNSDINLDPKTQLETQNQDFIIWKGKFHESQIEFLKKKIEEKTFEDTLEVAKSNKKLKDLYEHYNYSIANNDDQKDEFYKAVKAKAENAAEKIKAAEARKANYIKTIENESENIDEITNKINEIITDINNLQTTSNLIKIDELRNVINIKINAIDTNIKDLNNIEDTVNQSRMKATESLEKLKDKLKTYLEKKINSKYLNELIDNYILSNNINDLYNKLNTFTLLNQVAADGDGAAAGEKGTATGETLIQLNEIIQKNKSIINQYYELLAEFNKKFNDYLQVNPKSSLDKKVLEHLKTSQNKLKNNINAIEKTAQLLEKHEKNTKKDDYNIAKNEMEMQIAARKLEEESQKAKEKDEKELKKLQDDLDPEKMKTDFKYMREFINRSIEARLNMFKRIANVNFTINRDFILRKFKGNFNYLKRIYKQFNEHLENEGFKGDRIKVKSVVQSIEDVINTINQLNKNFTNSLSAKIDSYKIPTVFKKEDGKWVEDLDNKNNYEQALYKLPTEEIEILDVHKERISEEIIKCNEKLLSLYQLKLVKMELIRNMAKDPQTLVLYLLKGLRLFFTYIALYLAARIFSPIYESFVYDQKKNPPGLWRFVLIFFGIDLALNSFLIVCLFLLKYIFKNDNNMFIIDGNLIRMFCFDYVVTMIFLIVIAMLISIVIIDKKYFKYRYEGLRAINAFGNMIFNTAVPIYLFPFFILM